MSNRQKRMMGFPVGPPDATDWQDATARLSRAEKDLRTAGANDFYLNHRVEAADQANAATTMKVQKVDDKITTIDRQVATVEVRLEAVVAELQSTVATTDDQIGVLDCRINSLDLKSGIRIDAQQSQLESMKVAQQTIHDVQEGIHTLLDSLADGLLRQRIDTIVYQANVSPAEAVCFFDE